MILFRKDWYLPQHKGAIVNYETTNRTWVRICGVLHKMGIENCLFPLALHNPLLKNVDPFSPTITKDEIDMVTLECKENPWYAMREIIRIPPVAGPNPVPIKANRANISLLWLFMNHVTTMLIQPRQTGKSVNTDGLNILNFCIAAVHSDINLLSKDDDLRVKNVTRIKEMIELLPSYLQLRTKKDSWNTEKLTIERLANTYRTSVPQASPTAAANLGRGMTIPINHIDEIAFIKNIDITLPELLAATTAAREEAAENGAPYGNIYTTTPGYLNSKSGEYAHQLYQEMFRWNEKLFDSNSIEELNSTILKNSKSRSPEVLLEYNHRQLGFTDDWLAERIAVSKGSKETIGSNFLNIWGAGSASSPIKKEYLKIIRDSLVLDPYLQTSEYGYITRWYISEHEVENYLNKRKLIMCLDTSEAIGNDDIGMVIRDASTGEVVAVGVYNETNLLDFSQWLMHWLITYDNITILIERQNSGPTILDILIRLCVANEIDPFKRLFNWVVNDCNVKKNYRDEVINVPFKKRDPVVYDKYSKLFGFRTSGGGRTSRSELYGDVFTTSIKYTGKDVRDTTVIDQLSGLTVRNGRIDHASGGHDDTIIAWLLGYWFLQKAENKSFYGFDPHMVLNSVVEALVEEAGGADAVYKRDYQIELKQDIDQLVLRLKEETNTLKSKLLTKKILHLYREIDTNIIKSFNIESIIESIEREKDKNRNYWK